MNASAGGDRQQAELSALIETLHSTFLRINELTSGLADAVIEPSSGTTYLLPNAQSELQRMEAIERHHAAERSAILDALPAQIALIDSHGCINAANKSWRAFVNSAQPALKSAGLGMLYCDVAQLCGALRDMQRAEVEAGIAGVLSGHSLLYTLEYHLEGSKDHSWFRLTVTPMQRDGGSGAVVMRVDISERYRADAKVAELRRRLERLIDQARVGILVHHNFQPILANREIAELLGLDDPASVMRLDDCRDLFDADQRESLSAWQQAGLRDSLPQQFSISTQRSDGEQRTLECRSFSIEWGGDLATCMMLTDVTAQRELSEQLRRSQRMDAIGQLTGGIAHDFNNLLTVILGNTELLAEQTADIPLLHSLAEMTAKAALRGAELTNRLLAFSRRQPLDPRPSDVNRQIAAMLALLQRSLGEQVEIAVEPAADLWPAMVDGGQLESALLNLCINARDAMAGGGRLRISTANVKVSAAEARKRIEAVAGDYVMVAVSDSGSGMDERTLRRAFEPFFTTKDAGKGSGLGLSMVYGFVQQSRGHVDIRSAPDAGTTVLLYLPRAQDTESRVDVPTLKPPVGQLHEKILVVEDDRMVRDYVRSQLASLGYDIYCASNGPEALVMLEAHEDFDLLFTDVVMPGGMSGNQLAELARRLRPELPVLYTSGYSENAIVHHGRLDAGVQLLQKPYHRQELAETVRRALDRVRQ